MVGAVVIVGTAALPICMGVAVLKYRLYELNRIISRVVSYTLITALLGGVYAGLILLASWALPSRNAVAVAVATLVIAALFNPLRKRVQHVVDRRFNRARYDAEAIVAAFSGRLRQTIDLDAIRGDLVGVVHEACQPAHVSVWLPRAGPHAPVPASVPPDADSLVKGSPSRKLRAYSASYEDLPSWGRGSGGTGDGCGAARSCAGRAGRGVRVWEVGLGGGALSSG